MSNNNENVIDKETEVLDVDVENDLVSEEKQEDTKTKKTKKSKTKSSDTKLKDLQAQNDELKAKVEENFNLYLSARAEFENYKRRTTEEKLNIFGDATIKCISELLPVVDNFERALALEVDDSVKAYADGIEMIYKQLIDTFKALGVEEIDAFEKPFDPNFHNGVMMVDDDRFDVQTVVEVFQKGYTLKGKVIRPSMVKVSNG